MIPKPNDSFMVYLLRCNGALEEVFTNKAQAEAHMRAVRKNSEHWRIQEKQTTPHQA